MAVLQLTNFRAWRQQAGQTVIEVLVAVGLAAVLLPAMATAVIASREGRAQEAERLQATALAREADEAVRSVREKGWSNIEALTSGTQYRPTISGNAWFLTAGAETIGTFTRHVVASDVERNAAGAIVTSGGTVDSSTRKITVTVSWTQPAVGSVVLEDYYQRYLGNATWTQTTQAEFAAGTETNTQATAAGQVELTSATITPQHIQSTSTFNNASATTLPLAFGSNTTAGNTIVVAVSFDTVSTAAVTCTDNRGNVYTTAFNTNDTTNTQALAICFAPITSAGATTVTATFGASTPTRRIAIHEYSNITNVVPAERYVSAVANNTTAANDVTSTSMTTIIGGDLIFGAAVETGAPTGVAITQGTGFTQRQVTTNELATQDQVQAVQGALASTMTFGTASRYVAGAVAFKTTGLVNDWSAGALIGSYNAAGTQDALDVFAVGNYAYIADGSLVSIFNVAIPTLPTLVGTYTAGSTVNHVYVDGNYMYVSTVNNTGELVIVNITNPAAPTTAATVNLTGNGDALTAFVQSGYAYVGRVVDATAGNNEFYIINVTTPTSPVVSGSVNFTGQVNNIKVNAANTYAFLATAIDAQEMVVVNVTTKTAPVVSTSYNSAGTADAIDLAINGNTLYLAELVNASGAELFVINVTTPTSPALLGTYEVNGSITGVSYANNFAYLSTAISSRQLIVLNVTTPATPTLTLNLNLGSSANDVKTVGDYAYIANTSNTQELMVVAPDMNQGPAGYHTTGTLESSSFDATASAAFNYLTFTSTEPASTDITFQVAVNNDNATWNYVGPDGTSGTSYSAAGSIRLSTTGRYFRYKATLTGPGSSTPLLSDITINYSP